MSIDILWYIYTAWEITEFYNLPFEAVAFNEWHPIITGICEQGVYIKMYKYKICAYNKTLFTQIMIVSLLILTIISISTDVDEYLNFKFV